MPVNSTKGKELPFNLIKINYDDPWQLKHTRTIKSAYKSAPFFEEYEDDIISLINEKHTYLEELNKAVLFKMMEILNKEQTINFSSKESIPANSISLLGHFKPSKMPKSHLNLKSYVQVFNYKFGFVPNLSILDILFNEGPYALEFLLHKAE